LRQTPFLFWVKSITGGAAPQDLAAGDLNGDGKVDVAVANYYSNTVSVLINNGDGLMPPRWIIPLALVLSLLVS